MSVLPDGALFHQAATTLRSLSSRVREQSRSAEAAKSGTRWVSPVADRARSGWARAHGSARTGADELLSAARQLDRLGEAVEDLRVQMDRAYRRARSDLQELASAIPGQAGTYRAELSTLAPQGSPHWAQVAGTPSVSRVVLADPAGLGDPGPTAPAGVVDIDPEQTRRLARTWEQAGEVIADGRASTRASTIFLPLPDLDAYGLPGRAAADLMDHVLGPAGALGTAAEGYRVSARTAVVAADAIDGLGPMFLPEVDGHFVGIAQIGAAKTAGTTLPLGSKELGALLDQARAAGMAPTAYAPVLQAYWQAKALERAGIDPATWKPELGVDANRATVLKVYEYYGAMYRAHPELEWAGMANLVGPSFAAGFMDLGMLRGVAQGVEDLPDPVKKALGPAGDGMGALAGASDAELAFYERTFLTMQKDIFLDMGASHEAYLSGGMGAVKELNDAGLFGNDQGAALNSWQLLDHGARSGSRAELDLAAKQFLHREQFVIIGKNWDRMREHEPTGQAMTYAMTVVGAASVPGSRYPGQVSGIEIPSEIRADLPGPIGLSWHGILPLPVPDFVPTVKLRTTIPDFNVSDRQARWNLIEKDTLPAYLRLLDEGKVAGLTSQDLEARIAANRGVNRLPAILDSLQPYRWRPVLRDGT